MATITKKDLVDRIANKTGQKRVVVKRILQEFLDEIVTELADKNRLEFRDFGVFEVKVRAARTAQNPKTLHPVTVPERAAVKFKPGRKMRRVVEEAPRSSEDAGGSATAPSSPISAQIPQNEVVVRSDVTPGRAAGNHAAHRPKDDAERTVPDQAPRVEHA